MRIALVCPYDIAYPGGVTNHVTQFASYARKLGHDVTIIAPASKKVGYDNFVTAGKAVPLPVKGGTVSRLAFSFWNFPKIKKLFNKEQYDIIHVHEPGAPLLNLFALAYAPQGKSVVVTTSHTNMPHSAFMNAYVSFAKSIGIARRLMRKVDLKIAVSEAAKSFISKYFPGNYIIISNGVDTQLFTPKATPIRKYKDGKLNILFVGRLGNNEKRKGLKYLVLAFDKLHSADPNARLIIVGPGKPDGETKKIVKASGNKDIIFAGRAKPEELPRYYATADIFCSPATHGESFGMVLVEAMASGKPIVASNIDGYRKVILGSNTKLLTMSRGMLIQTGTGVLFPTKDKTALAAALEILVKNKNLRTRMGRAGRALAIKNYSWQKIARQVLNAYEKAISAKKKKINAGTGI